MQNGIELKKTRFLMRGGKVSYASCMDYMLALTRLCTRDPNPHFFPLTKLLFCLKGKKTPSGADRAHSVQHQYIKVSTWPHLWIIRYADKVQVDFSANLGNSHVCNKIWKFVFFNERGFIPPFPCGSLLADPPTTTLLWILCAEDLYICLFVYIFQPHSHASWAQSNA